eukprot:5645062-Amphidinium_carterae.2
MQPRSSARRGQQQFMYFVVGAMVSSTHGELAPLSSCCCECFAPAEENVATGVEKPLATSGTLTPHFWPAQVVCTLRG